MDSTRPVIPPVLAGRMRAVHGRAGAAWAESAPDRIEEYARAWGFEPGEPFPDLTYAYVAPVTLSDGSEGVLKAQPPHLESRSEIAALAAWDGGAAVRLLRADADVGIALLERLRPGTRLAGVAGDDEPIRIAAGLMPRLWREPPADPALITAERWGQGFDDHLARYPDGGPVPRDTVQHAATVWRRLLATTPGPRLLHGDLHHDNILSAAREPWLAIDPKGIVGDPHLEPAMLLVNPRERVRASPDLEALFARRMEIVAAETGLDPGRVAGWSFARAVLGLTWDLAAEPRSGADEWLRQAYALQRLLPDGLRSLPSS